MHMSLFSHKLDDAISTVRSGSQVSVDKGRAFQQDQHTQIFNFGTLNNMRQIVPNIQYSTHFTEHLAVFRENYIRPITNINKLQPV